MDSHIRTIAREDIEQSNALARRAARGKDGAWLEATIPLIIASPNGSVFGAYSSGSEHKLIALGSVTQSMHDFCHVGLNLLAVEPGSDSTPEVKALIRRMVSHGESINPLPQDQDISDLPSTDMLTRRYLVFSVGTTNSELFAAHGFHSIRTWRQHDGQEHHWMMKGVPHKAIEILPDGHAQACPDPQIVEGLVRVESEAQLERAAEVVRQEWGDVSAEAFKQEWYDIRNMPGSALYILEEKGAIASVGSVIKAHHHPGAWSKAWIVTSRAERGKGHAEKLVRGLHQHALQSYRDFTDGPMLFETSAFIPQYYQRFGDIPVARSAIPTADGKHATWLLHVATR